MRAKKGRRWKVAVLMGDGIGPEVVEASLDVLESAKARFGIGLDLQYADAGYSCIEKYGTNLPEDTIRLLKKTDCVIKGPMTTPEGPTSEMSAAVKIRRMFKLYADVRPCKARPNIPSIGKDTDLVIVRENSEGMYSGLDFNLSPDLAVGIRVVTKSATERIGRFAFELAQKRRKHLTIVHKGNILKASDGLFKATIESLHKRYPRVRLDDAHVDAMSQWLIKKPQDYDVLVMENLFGDILSDEAAMVVGGVGVVPSANIGSDFAMFEPVHGSAPKYAGMDKADPIGTILSVKMMLEWMGHGSAANAIENAVSKSLSTKFRTYDLGGSSKCSEVGKYISGLVSRAD
ncbi:MAG: isocitrate/isopropylmalate dehydrogenase family protein [Candidatus Micrarchaeota archaeon]|nr:isocitrate/isopropylmalate dehydrogenase family protein [Candidatus Micrarchaeota archaeon]